MGASKRIASPPLLRPQLEKLSKLPAAGFEQSGHKPARGIGAIGPHPEQNYGRRRSQAARKDEITVIAVERYDPALLGLRKCEYLAVAHSPAAFKNRGYVIAPVTQISN